MGVSPVPPLGKTLGINPVSVINYVDSVMKHKVISVMQQWHKILKCFRKQKFDFVSEFSARQEKTALCREYSKLSTVQSLIPFPFLEFEDHVRLLMNHKLIKIHTLTKMIAIIYSSTETPLSRES